MVRSPVTQTQPLEPELPSAIQFNFNFCVALLIHIPRVLE